MKNVLIDTCSLIDLLSLDKNKLLPHLVFWKENNCINFVTHEMIIEEWNNHKQRRKKEFTEILNTKYKHAFEIGKKEKLFIPTNLKPDLENINNQIETIDEILSNSIKLRTTEDVKAYCSDRTLLPRKAPFHNKIDSTKDAYIIFSALKYFTDINQDFCFISSNKSDFGAPGNLETEIHPEIVYDYRQINVQYVSDIGRAINYLKDELPISLLPTEINKTYSNKAAEEIVIDKTKPILDQVYEYISKRHREINFYPISLLIDHYPFGVNSYYSTFDLYTDNEKIFELFKAIDVSENNKININDDALYKNVDNYYSKIKFILEELSANLIFILTNSKTRERLSIRYSEQKNCQCPNCCFNKFKFSDCFNNINSFTDSLDDLQKSSYLNYQIGNYLYAIQKQKKVFEASKAKQLNTLSFICQFNLSKLSIFIENNYYGDNSKDSLLDELKEINLKYAEAEFSSRDNQRLLRYLVENKYYYDSKNKILEKTNELIDQYYSSLNGGWSSNMDVWNLINEFAQFESLTVNNFLVYDKFKEFQDIFSLFTEGLFASYAIANTESSRLEYFDDWIITKMLYYGDSELINKLYIRYKLKKIRYKKTSSNGDSFEELIDNYFNNVNLRESFERNCETNVRRFWVHYDNIFRNIITLVSICDLNIEYKKIFSEKLITYLLSDPKINANSYSYVNKFLYRSIQQIDGSLLSKYLGLGIQCRYLHKSGYFDELQNISEKNKIRIRLNEQSYTKLWNIAFETCSLCNEDHSNSLIVPIYTMIDNDDYRKSFSEAIKSKLDVEFSLNLFYLATLFEVIPLDSGMLDLAIKLSLPNDGQVSFKSAISGEQDKRFDMVNSILNLCFKYNIDTSTKQFESYKELDPYYCWLVDMDNFNYELFNAEWIGEYTTRFYFRRIYRCKAVQEKLNLLIKEINDSRIERDYINIYVRRTWDVNEK